MHTRILLEESDSPTHWYNVVADMPVSREYKEGNKAKTILFNLSGHGHFDRSAYDRYFNNELEDYEFPAEAIEESLLHLPEVLRNT